MKRSQMIKIISKYLRNHYSSMSEASLDNFDLTAECLLEDLEYYGMYAPYPKGPFNPEELKDGWEPEDD